MVSWSTSGRPRQFSVMWQKRRCSILFHLDVCFSYPHTLPSALDGDTRVGTVTTPGQTVAWTFTATAGQRASITSSAVGHATHKLYAPSGAQLFSDTTGVVNMFSGALALPEPGTYRWVVDPTAMALPSESVTAYLLPDDLAEVATIGGDATPMDFDVPGLNGSVSFTAATGDVVSITFARSGGFTGASYYLYAPSGATVVEASTSGTAYFDRRTLTEDGWHL